MSNVAIATCSEVLHKDHDDLEVIAALERRGIGAAHVCWDDPAADWSSFALVVIRSTWDYPGRCAEFLSWAERQPRVLNPLAILRWNTHKRYLEDLAAARIPVVPTQFIEPGDAFEPPTIPFVVKPAISCGAKDTGRYGPEQIGAARQHVSQLLSAGRTVMIQPYLSSIETTGEISLTYIGGVYSHAICRDPSLKRSGLPSKDEVSPLSVDAYLNVRKHATTKGERELADRVMSYVLHRAPDLLYARVDLIPDQNVPVVLEVELTEPTLFLAKFSEEGVERLTECIARAL